jgi:hypothetical protein
MPLTSVNLVTPKAGAKHELLFNKSASGQSAYVYGKQGTLTIDLLIKLAWFVERFIIFSTKMS